MVGLRAIKAIKLTPSLLVRLLLIPLRKVEVPCLYCPGICIASCPTFLRSGNMALSPLGYSRNPDLGRERCLKCWRCALECPLGYELPERFSGQVDLELEVIREGSPMLLSVEGLDLEYGVEISLRMNAGLCVVRGLLRRYDEGCSISRRSLLRVKRKIKGLGRVISLSPEASHSLGIPFFLEEAHDLPVRLDYRGPVHMPCLLMGREEAVLRGLTSIGADPTEILNVCMKQDTPNALTLCPRASSLGLPCIYDLLEFPNSGSQG